MLASLFLNRNGKFHIYHSPWIIDLISRSFFFDANLFDMIFCKSDCYVYAWVIAIRQLHVLLCSKMSYILVTWIMEFHCNITFWNFQYISNENAKWKRWLHPIKTKEKPINEVWIKIEQISSPYSMLGNLKIRITVRMTHSEFNFKNFRKQFSTHLFTELTV